MHHVFHRICPRLSSSSTRLLMIPKNFKLDFSLAKSILIFFTGILIGSAFYRSTNIPCSKLPLHFNAFSPSMISESIKRQTDIAEETLKSFSFAYNRTHLWSMRLADENYYRIGNQLPCRTVQYTGGPKSETMNYCDPSTQEEFSVATTLQAQRWFYEHQHPADCKNKKIAIINQFAWSGFGSTVHQIVWAFGVALAEGRIAVYEVPGNWLYGSCKLANPDCVFLPISNCSVPTTVDGTQTTRIKADFGHWSKPIHPPIFQNRSFNWFRSQMLFYLMRYNPETLAHVQGAVAKYLIPPSVDLHHPYISVYVRRSDKVQSGEMATVYPLQQYFNLFQADARLTNITTVYLNSEDENAFNEFHQLNNKTAGYYKLLSIQAKRNIVFRGLVNMPMPERGKIVLEFLTDLFIEVNADLHSGTLSSNWCRLVDEVRLVLGKMIPFYTPENRFLVDM